MVRPRKERRNRPPVSEGGDRRGTGEVHSSGHFGCVNSRRADKRPGPIPYPHFTNEGAELTQLSSGGARDSDARHVLPKPATPPLHRAPRGLPGPPAAGGWGPHTNPLGRTASPMRQPGPRLVLLPTRSPSQAGKRILPTLKLCLLRQMEPSLIYLIIRLSYVAFFLSLQRILVINSSPPEELQQRGFWASLTHLRRLCGSRHGGKGSSIRFIYFSRHNELAEHKR